MTAEAPTAPVAEQPIVLSEEQEGEATGLSIAPSFAFVNHANSSPGNIVFRSERHLALSGGNIGADRRYCFSGQFFAFSRDAWIIRGDCIKDARLVGLVGAVTIDPKGLIAVVAEHPKRLRVAVSHYPLPPHSDNRLSMRATSTVDVVETKKLDVFLAAASASRSATTVMREHLESHRAVIGDAPEAFTRPAFRLHTLRSINSVATAEIEFRERLKSLADCAHFHNVHILS